MQETLYDWNGDAIAYLDYYDEYIIYLWNGQAAAYLSDGNTIYGFNGKHLGWYEDGICRDLHGVKTGFNQHASPVFLQTEPFKAFKQFKPFPLMREFPKMKPYWNEAVNKSSLSDFLLAGAL